MKPIYLLLVFVVIAIIIANGLGRKRQIGFSWSLFFCIFLSPLVGFIITMLSRKFYEAKPEPSNAKKVWGWIFIIFFSLSVVGQINFLRNGRGDINALFMALGLIGLGFYLIQLGQGKSFNNVEVIENEE